MFTLVCVSEVNFLDKVAGRDRRVRDHALLNDFFWKYALRFWLISQLWYSYDCCHIILLPMFLPVFLSNSVFVSNIWNTYIVSVIFDGTNTYWIQWPTQLLGTLDSVYMHTDTCVHGSPLPSVLGHTVFGFVSHCDQQLRKLRRENCSANVTRIVVYINLNCFRSGVFTGQRSFEQITRMAKTRAGPSAPLTIANWNIVRGKYTRWRKALKRLQNMQNTFDTEIKLLLSLLLMMIIIYIIVINTIVKYYFY